MRSTLSCILMAICLISCQTTSNMPEISNEDAKREAKLQKEIAVKELTKYKQRMLDVAQPILTRNTQMCEKRVAPYTGFYVTSKSSVAKEFREAFKDVYGIDEYPTVHVMAKKSPASKILKIGDIIREVEGKSISKGRYGEQQITKALRKKKDTQPVALTIERDGEIYADEVKTVMACDFGLLYEASDGVNAFADGDNIIISRGIMNFARDDNELALVIGHELAHNTHKHVATSRGNAVLGTILGAATSVAIGVDVTQLGAAIGGAVNSQSFESEADYVGLYYTARAGYNIDDAPNLWRRIGASNPGAIHLAGSSHPSTAKRFLALDAAVKEIKEKQAKSRPLLPEKKEIRDIEQRKAHEMNN